RLRGGEDRGAGRRGRRRTSRHHPLPERRTLRRQRLLTRDDPMATVASAPASLDRETGLALYRIMQECRLLETRAQELFFEGLVRGTTHLGVGQEAVAAGFAVAMRPDDHTFCTYRGQIGRAHV